MPDLPDGLDVVPVDYQPDFAGPWQQLPHPNGVPQITIPLSQQATAQQTNLGDQPTPKAGQTVQQPNVMSDISSMPGKVAGAAADVTGVSDAYKAATGQMTPEEAQMFALGALPALAAGPEEKIAQGVAEDVMPAAAKAIRAFHGSPYDFDQFDLSKIGTGEGAQAYGHGLYFAENPQVATDYKNRLTTGTSAMDQTAQYWVNQANGDKPLAKQLFQQSLGKEQVPPTHPVMEAIDRSDAGKMYEVNINADPEHFLDWDKPLSEQSPHVQQAIAKVDASVSPQAPNISQIRDPQIRGIVKNALKQNEGQADGLELMIDNDSGLYNAAVNHAKRNGVNLEQNDMRASDYVYQQAKGYIDALHASQNLMGDSLAKVLGIKGADMMQAGPAAARLRDAGIPGIRYLDQGSRSDGNGTRNYVVFNDKLIDIVKKYGLAGLIAGGASHFQTVPVDNQPDFGDQQGMATGGAVKAHKINHNPTEAQKEAGNYAKDHVRIHGLDISIENAKGHYRRGVDRGGKAWAVKMPAHYGYIKGTVGKDKDHVDVYVGPHRAAPNVFVIDQLDADSKKFDEHKAFIGFASRNQVEQTYKRAFSDGRVRERIGNITEMPIEQFKRWLNSGDTTKPLVH